MPCSRSAERPSTSSAKSRSPPRVPHLLRVGRQRRELIVEDHLRFVEQPADQRRLAVVDAAAGDEAQQALVLVALEVGVDVGRRSAPGRRDIRSSLRASSFPSTRLVVVDDPALALGRAGRAASPR